MGMHRVCAAAKFRRVHHETGLRSQEHIIRLRPSESSLGDMCFPGPGWDVHAPDLVHHLDGAAETVGRVPGLLRGRRPHGGDQDHERMVGQMTGANGDHPIVGNQGKGEWISS